MKPVLVDVGFERILMPAETRQVSFQPQRLFRADHLFIEEQFGVMLLGVKVGNRDQQWDPVSTLFYSVPSCPKTLDRIKKLIAKQRGQEPDIEMLQHVWADKADPAAALGLPVHWDSAEVGNVILLLFQNRSADPVRVTVVLRGKTAM